jgi:hypothetical protein
VDAKFAIQKMRNKYTCYIKLDVWKSESARLMQLECDEIADFIEHQAIQLVILQSKLDEWKENNECNLDFKNQLVSENRNQRAVIKQQENQLQESQHRERVLQEKLDKIQETHTDNEGYVWENPTSYAYAMACKALHDHKEKERVLRKALEWYADPRNEESGDVAREALEASK